MSTMNASSARVGIYRPEGALWRLEGLTQDELYAVLEAISVTARLPLSEEPEPRQFVAPRSINSCRELARRGLLDQYVDLA